MNFGNVKMLGTNLTKAIGKNSPTILTCIGVAGVAGTAILAVKATPKAMLLMDIAKAEKQDDLTKFETFKACWKPYVPAVVLGVLTMSSIVGANYINLKRNAAILSLYAASKGNMKEYEKKVRELLGDKKADEIRDGFNDDLVKNTDLVEDNITSTINGSTLFFEPYSARYFNSSPDSVRRVENTLNKRMIGGDIVSMNDLYYELGLSDTKLGDDSGWYGEDNLLEIRLSSHIVGEDKPCLVVDWNVLPEVF